MTWPPVRSITLEAVVGRRIVRGRDHDSGVAAEVPDGEGEQGGGAGFRKEENLESSGGQHAGAQLSELQRSYGGSHARSHKSRADLVPCAP